MSLSRQSTALLSTTKPTRTNRQLQTQKTNPNANDLGSDLQEILGKFLSLASVIPKSVVSYEVKIS